MRPINLSEPVSRHFPWYRIDRWPLWMMPFRPYFLAGGLLALLSVLYWGLLLAGKVTWALSIPATLWHAHEMIFGFVAVVAVGFVLTAAQTWTGVPTMSGTALLLSSLLWLAARFAFFVPKPDSPEQAFYLVGLLQGSWWVCMIAKFADMLLTTRSRHNYPLIGIFLVLAVLNLVFLYLAKGGHTVQALGLVDTAVLVVTLLIGVIAGRVVPFFTARRLDIAQVRKPGLDRLVFWLSVAAIMAFFAVQVVDLPDIAPWLIVAVALLHLYRCRVWWHRGIVTVPLLWSLHLSYLCLGTGMFLMGLALTGWLLPFKDALHLVTIGAMGLMIISMMTRVSHGHTGRSLEIPAYVAGAFILVASAAFCRSLLPLLVAPHVAWQISALLWVAGFALFLLHVVGILTYPRADGRRG